MRPTKPLLSSRQGVTSVTPLSRPIAESLAADDGLAGLLARVRASQARLVWVNRLSIVVLGLVPFWCASLKLADVQAIDVEQAKFIASFFFVPVVLGLNWRRGTKEGAIWSMVAGFLGCLVWSFTFQRGFASHGIDAVEVGVALSTVTFILVSRATPPTPAENLRIFFDRVEPRTSGG